VKPTLTHYRDEPDGADPQMGLDGAGLPDRFTLDGVDTSQPADPAHATVQTILAVIDRHGGRLAGDQLVGLPAAAKREILDVERQSGVPRETLNELLHEALLARDGDLPALAGPGIPDDAMPATASNDPRRRDDQEHTATNDPKSAAWLALPARPPIRDLLQEILDTGGLR
jgi:hypothetical protein